MSFKRDVFKRQNRARNFQRITEGNQSAKSMKLFRRRGRRLALSAPLALDSSAPRRMERSCSAMSQQLWRWTLPILWLRPQPPLPPPNPRHRRTRCALARRASASWAARDPVIRRLIITRYGFRQISGGAMEGGREGGRQTTRDEPRCLLAVLVPRSLSGSSVRWSLGRSLSTHKEGINCKWVEWLSVNRRH